MNALDVRIGERVSAGETRLLRGFAADLNASPGSVGRELAHLDKRAPLRPISAVPNTVPTPRIQPNPTAA